MLQDPFLPANRRGGGAEMSFFSASQTNILINNSAKSMHPSKTIFKHNITLRAVRIKSSFNPLFLHYCSLFAIAAFNAKFSLFSHIPMNFDDHHPSSTLSSASAITPAHQAQDDDMEDELSDSGFSQFEAEIEENLSSASPDTSAHNDTNDDASDDAMDVDSEEDVKPSHTNKGRKGANTREYFDPELYGLRRSVCFPCIDGRKMSKIIMELICVGSCAS